MGTAECSTLGTVWCLARVIGRVGANSQFVKKSNPPKNPSPPVCLKLSIGRFGILTPGRWRHSKLYHEGGCHLITGGAAQRRETYKVRGTIIPFLTGFAT